MPTQKILDWLYSGTKPQSPAEVKNLAFFCVKQTLPGALSWLVLQCDVDKLSLDRCDLGTAGARMIGSWLEHFPRPIALHLRYCRLEDEGAIALAAVLQPDSTLTSLNLAHNYIGDAGAVALADGIRINSTLSSLDMSFNIIRATGAAAFGVALETNSAVTWLDMSGNELGTVGGDAIAVSLETNSALTSLDIKWNFVGARAFADAIKTDITLTSLNLSTCTSDTDIPSDNEIDRRLGTNKAAKPLFLPAARAFMELPTSPDGQLPRELGDLIVRHMLMPGRDEGHGLEGVKSLVIANDIVKQRQCDGTG